MSLEVFLGLHLALDYIRGRQGHDSCGRYKATGSQLQGSCHHTTHSNIHEKAEFGMFIATLGNSLKSQQAPGAIPRACKAEFLPNSPPCSFSVLSQVLQSSLPIYLTLWFSHQNHTVGVKFKQSTRSFCVCVCMCICIWILSGLSDKLPARRPHPWCFAWAREVLWGFFCAFLVLLLTIPRNKKVLWMNLLLSSFAVFHKHNQKHTLHSTLVLLPAQLSVPRKAEKC